ncbi:MAG: MgtC/SapB family protein [Actinobacteria bacterium]|nr:MAG: MgtC/SapB family protein [Actinomycetota bacterium]
MPSQTDLILRLLLASALAGLLGGERELTDQPAGFRTHILVGLGAALFSVISAYGFETIVGSGPSRGVSADPTRIASQIVVGIGFLGGGAIIKYGASIRGLTTAASLWVTAAVGTAVGIGALMLGTVTTGITLVALVGLRPLRRLIRRYARDRDEYVVEASHEVDLAALLARIRELGATVEQVRIVEEGPDRSIRVVARPSQRTSPTQIAAAISAMEHVREVDWSS